MPEALRSLHSAPCTAADLASMQHRVDAEAVALVGTAHLHHARTLCLDGEPLCCFGITSPWPGLGVAWFLERDGAQCRRHAVRIGREIQRWFACWGGDYRRLEALTPATRPDAQRLAAWLGFRQSVVKPHYGPGDETMIEWVCYPKGE